MNLALAITLASVAVGGALAAMISRGRMWLEVLRTFAITAVATLAAVQLLPEAVEALGPIALLLFIAALALPPLFAAVARRFRRDDAGVTAHGVGIELGYFGFVAHQFVEGLALGAYSGPQVYDHDHVELVLAVAAHTVPMTALFIGNIITRRGGKPAIRRIAALIVASTAGFLAAEWVTESVARTAAPTLAALVAGFLSHVLLHGVGTGRPRPTSIRMLDVVAVAGGIALPMVSVHSHGEGGGLHAALLAAWWELAVETAPMLLLGLVLGALLQAWGSRISRGWLRSGSVSRQALRGIAIGAPLPLCACGVLPIAEGLRRRGASAALVVAFLISTPELGPETLTLTVRFMGWPFMLVRLGAALLVAYVAAVVFARIVGAALDPAGGDASSAASIVDGHGRRGGTLGRLAKDFDELLLHTAPWTIVGLLAAAYIEVAFAPDSLAPLAEQGLDILVVAIVALPTYVCAASATPLAAVLVLKGVSPGAVLVGLLLGPATNVATIAVLGRAYGRRAAWIGVGAIAACACAIGYGVNAVGLRPTLPTDLAEHHGHSIFSWSAIAALVVALVWQLWRWGLGPWLSILDAGGHGDGHSHGEDAHGHGHAHGDGHDHGRTGDHARGHDHDHDHDHDHGHDHAHDHDHDHDHDHRGRS